MTTTAPRPVAEAAAGRHRAVTDAARWLDANQALPVELRAISNGFANLAIELLNAIPLDDPQLTRCLDTLTQAKDYAVRAGRASIDAASVR